MADYSSDSDSSVHSDAFVRTPHSPWSEHEGTPVSPPPRKENTPPPPAPKKKKRRRPAPPKTEGTKSRGRPAKDKKPKTDEDKKPKTDEDDKPKRHRKSRDVPSKPARFVISDDNFLKYKAYLDHLLQYETPKQWADRLKKEKRRLARMGRDWKKKGDIDISKTVDAYKGFLKDSDHDFSEFDGKWLTTFGIKDVFPSKTLKKVDLDEQPVQFRAALTLFTVAKEKGYKPLGIYAAKLDTYDNGVPTKGAKSPEGDSVYVGPRNSLQGMNPHPLSLPTKLKVHVDRTDDMKLGVGEDDF